MNTKRRRRTAPTGATPEAVPRITDLHTLQAFQDANSHLWPSLESMRWFVRMHRAELVAAGAVVEIAGRVLVHGPRFTEQALKIGQDNLTRHVDTVRG